MLYCTMLWRDPTVYWCDILISRFSSCSLSLQHSSGIMVCATIIFLKTFFHLTLTMYYKLQPLQTISSYRNLSCMWWFDMQPTLNFRHNIRLNTRKVAWSLDCHVSPDKLPYFVGTAFSFVLSIERDYLAFWNVLRYGRFREFPPICPFFFQFADRIGSNFRWYILVSIIIIDYSHHTDVLTNFADAFQFISLER